MEKNGIRDKSCEDRSTGSSKIKKVPTHTDNVRLAYFFVLRKESRLKGTYVTETC
jgi:hypothetical protein